MSKAFMFQNVSSLITVNLLEVQTSTKIQVNLASIQAMKNFISHYFDHFRLIIDKEKFLSQ
jgi:hypothetical protein